MSDKNILNKDLTGMIVRDFNISNDQFEDISFEYDDIKKRLIQVLDFLLEKDFERLLNAMYRMDINEHRFREVIDGRKGNNISEILADMIIKRELQKVKTRIKYRDKA